MVMDKKIALAILGLAESNPSTTKIKGAYRSAMRINHPDKYLNDETLRMHAEEQCRLINEARDVLMSSSQKANSANQEQSEWGQETTDFYEDTRDKNTDTTSQSGESNHQPHDGHEKESSPNTNFGFSITPLLDIWKTSIKYSILGLFSAILSGSIFPETLTNMSPRGLLIILIISILYTIAMFYYAAVVYPSYFGASPKIKSVKLISFLNWFVGGPFFGPVWNRNLTKRTKGYSYVVFIILIVVGELFSFFA